VVPEKKEEFEKLEGAGKGEAALGDLASARAAK